MELRIRDSQNIIDIDFGLWLLPRIRSKLVSNIQKYILVNWDKYLTNSDKLPRIYKKDYRTEDIIIFAAKNLVCKGVAGDISIQFDANKFVPGFDRVKLNVLVKTINYGTLDIKGCPIFEDTFKYFSTSIDDFVKSYYSF